MNPNLHSRRLAGALPGLLLAFALLPLAALGQANCATPYTFITVAGKAGVPGNADGTNSTARFNGPMSVALDTDGNLYVADFNDFTIRKITPVGTNWVVTTLAGKAGVSGSADGTNGTARFNYPEGVAVDNAGNVYVVDDANRTIRKIAPVGTNWVVTTLAGKAGVPGTADGTNSAARFVDADGLAVDTAGNLYVADTGDEAIRKLTPVGTNWVVTTVAGKAGVAGSADGTNSEARFNAPYGLAVDTNGNLFVSDQGNVTIRKITPVGTNWVVTTLAGKAGYSGSVDGTNSAATFGFVSLGNGLGYLSVDTVDNLYVADYVNNTIRKVTPAGTNWVVSTLAGKASVPGSVDGTGNAARFNGPNGVAVNSGGNLYVVDYNDDTIREGFPASSVPPPILHPASLSNGQFGFGLTGLPGLPLNIEASTDLVNWQIVGTCCLSGGTNCFVCPSPASGAEFYRTQVR